MQLWKGSKCSVTFAVARHGGGTPWEKSGKKHVKADAQGRNEVEYIPTLTTFGSINWR